MVDYTQTLRHPLTDAYSKQLQETYNVFHDVHKVSILGEGIKDVMADPALFSEYVDSLTEGLDPTEAENVSKLMKNARMQTYSESSISGIAPVASLTFPVIRKLWARTGLVRAIPTEVVKTNAFKVSFNHPYIVDEKGEKHYLPEAIDDLDHDYGSLKKLTEDALTLPLNAHDLLADVGCSKATGDSVDLNFTVASATVDIDGTDTEVVINRKEGKIDINDKINVEIKDDKGVEVDQLFGKLDRYNGTLTLISMSGKVKSVKIRGFVASDAHNHSTNAGFDIDNRDITIGTAEHFEASLPLEFLQDTMATYQIDGTTELVDTLSNVIAQTLDQRIFKFIRDLQTNANRKYEAEFDLRPSAGFAGQPKDWREELKTVIDRVAIELKKVTHAYQGYFAIVGSPIDMMVLPNVNWTFNHLTDQQGGVEVDYNIGAVSGQNNYVLVSSDIIPDGALYGIFVPTTDKFMNVKYYPYTFNVVDNNGYRNTRMPNVPSIMMTRRDTIEEFMELIFKINILNNNANMLKELPR